MAKNEEEKVDDVDETLDEEEIEEEHDDDATDWKAEAMKARGIAKRNATRLAKLKKAAETKIETTTPPAKKEKEEERKGFDYAEKAYLRSSGIHADEYDLVLEVMQSTGKSLDEVLEAKYFQAELKERREVKATRDAVPSGSKRSSPASRDSVEYWIAKGELPPRDQVELRRKVLRAKENSEERKSQFSDNPIV